MALYRPTNIIPSSFSGAGNGTVDITQELQVSWQVEGSSAMTAYQVTIQANDTASTQVYDSGKVTLDTPFYGTDYAGNIQRYSTVIPAADLTALSNGYEDGYKLKIKEWWSESDDDSVEQVQPAFFVTRTAPVLTMHDIPSPLNLRKYTFSAGYTQAEGDTLNWFRWMVAEAGSLDSPLKDTGNIYGTEDIRCAYDGFFTGNKYAVRCLCETENGIQADTGWVEFQVEYSLSDLNGLLRVCKTSIQDCLLLSWAAIRFINGSASGDYSIADGMLTLKEGASVVWDQVNGAAMQFDPPWSIAWKGQLLARELTVLKLSGADTVLTIEAAAEGLYVRMDTEVLFFLEVPIYEEDEWVIALTPDSIWFRLDRYINGLYPRTDLYPAATLYPDKGVPASFRFHGEMDYTQFAITNVTLLGPQVCEYLWIEKGTFSAGTLEQLIEDTSYEPAYDDNTYMIADFQYQLNAGNLKSPNEEIVGTAIYRRENGAAQLDHLLDIPLTVTQFLDYGFRNQKAYQYYLFPQGENTFVSAPLESQTVYPTFWNWTLLVCREDDAGIFHVENQYVFRNDVSSGTIENGSAPGVLKNFTRYPLIQQDAANYRGGTLTALIGRVDQEKGCYEDSIELAEEIYALSTDTRPKFLKDRKGNLMRVELSAAVIMQTGDTQAPQPYTVQLPWVEIDGCDGVSIVQTTDDGIPNFHV